MDKDNKDFILSMLVFFGIVFMIGFISDCVGMSDFEKQKYDECANPTQCH